jgi:prepilin-type N-terminal cleavage/methylation domain-containing protein
MASTQAQRPGSQAGFTLVETLVAIVVLVFGLMAVTNLLAVAASSNSVANQSSAATASASRIMDILHSTDFRNLPPGSGSLTADTNSPSPACSSTTVSDTSVPLTVFNCDDAMPGVGTIKTRWTIAAVPGTARLLQITVRSEGTGTLSVGRSRATFTVYRACTQSSPNSCPASSTLPNRECCPT